MLVMIPLSVYVFFLYNAGSDYAYLLTQAATYDMTLLVPLVYFLLIYKTRIPKFSVFPVFILMVVIASYILPEESQVHLNKIKYFLLPALEIGVVFYAIFKFFSIKKEYGKLKKASPDFTSNIKQIFNKILPSVLSEPLSMEISMFYYGFFRWRQVKTDDNIFTIHKSGILATLWVFLFMLAVETSVVHLLLYSWKPTVAWIVLAISIYSALQLLAMTKALYLRPIRIEDNRLFINYGIIRETEIEFNDIQSIIYQTKEDKSDGVLQLSPFKDLESSNVLIELHEEKQLKGVFGYKKPFQKLALHLDDPKKFISTVESRLTSKDKSNK